MIIPPRKRLLSVIVPVFNERDSLKRLCGEIAESAGRCRAAGQIGAYDIWFIDDGSADDSPRIIRELIAAHPHINGIFFRRNCGKARALQAGFRHAAGDLILTMDADLQDDPAEIPRFIDALDKGVDLVSGWKKHRNDPLEKRLPSRLFNRVISKVFGIKLHDFNCGFKLYRKELADSLDIYGGLHRYMPVLAVQNGFKVAEIPIAHRARSFGKSKYGWERYAHGLLDALSVWFVGKYAEKPMYFFGKGALISFAVALGIAAFVLFAAMGSGAFVVLSVLAALFVLLGVQLLTAGLIAESVLRASARRRDAEHHIAEIIRAEPQK